MLVHQENKHILTILGKSAVVLTRLGDKRLAIMIPIGLAENSNSYLITRVRQGQILKSVSKAEANSTTTFSCFGKSCKFKLKCIHVCVWWGVRGVGGSI